MRVWRNLGVLTFSWRGLIMSSHLFEICNDIFYKKYLDGCITKILNLGEVTLFQENIKEGNSYFEVPFLFPLIDPH